ncbi:hypothetical protein QJS10_CPA03g00080 [Acorus calamus]|uniref:Uncharacterized protein n=1 Tax=Acorus calamus TaxID=4465 RepID=A0AAV9F5U0_ACOCL|nr:hypothetical protein QJS10_CPA03g00080 [Acorus calamus]
MAVIMPCHHIISPVFFALSHSHSSPIPSLSLPNNLRSAIARARARQPEQWLAELPQPDPQLDLQSEPQVGEEGGGPIELPPSSSSLPIFATSDDPSPLQVATSVLLTGAITVFLFRSLRRRAKRAKELRVRSTGVTKKGLKEEALDTLKAMQSVEIDAGKPPSPVQALLGGISAGVIAIILYKFATTVEASLNRQTISDNFSRDLRKFRNSHNKKQKIYSEVEGSVSYRLKFTVREGCSGSSNNNNNKDYCERVVLSRDIRIWHQLHWIDALFWSACPEFLHGTIYE